LNWLDDPIMGDMFAGLDGHTTASGCAIVYGQTHKVMDDLSRIPSGPVVLVTHNSDMLVTQKHLDALPANVQHWYTVNCGVKDPRVTALPIGLANSQDKLDTIRAVADAGVVGVHHSYLCATWADHPSKVARKELYHWFGDEPWVTVKGGIDKGDVDYATFCYDVAEHAFVFSPEGAGPDCHRHWEALYLGSIPIVKRSAAMDHFADLPLLMVDDWARVTPEWLNQQTEELRLWHMFNSDAMRRTTFAYWREAILS